MPLAEHIVQAPVSSLKLPDRQIRHHSERQVNALAASISEFGFVMPILVDRENVVIAGSGRVMAARVLGMEQVPCVLASDLNEAQARAYAIADNRLGELSSWDAEKLSRLLGSVEGQGDIDMSLLGFEIGDAESRLDELKIEVDRKENEETHGGRRKQFGDKGYHVVNLAFCPHCGYRMEKERDMENAVAS